MQVFSYKVYGLNVSSQIELPELLPGEVSAQEALTDNATGNMIHIRQGKVPSSLGDSAEKGVLYQAMENDFILRMKDVGAFRVQDGNTVTVDPFEEKPSGLFRVFLLGSVMGALLHQRRILPLHGSAIGTAKGGLIIAGRSAAGKSTLAASMAARSHTLVADDISALAETEKGFMLQAGIPRLKLWKDALEKTGLDTGDLEKVRQSIEKYARNMSADFATGALPLQAILVLHPWNRDEIQIRELSGTEKFEELRAHTYRHEFIHPLGRTMDHFRMLSQLCSAIPVYHVQRPATTWRTDELCSRIEKEIIKHG